MSSELEPLAYQSPASRLPPAQAWIWAISSLCLAFALPASHLVGANFTKLARWAYAVAPQRWMAIVGLAGAAIVPSLCGFVLAMVAWRLLRGTKCHWPLRLVVIASLILNGTQVAGLVLEVVLLALLFHYG